jgi:putative transposase
MPKIPPSQKIQRQIQQLLAQGATGDGSVVAELLTLGAQRAVQELLEQEVTQFLGRDHYQRGPRRIRRYWNGYRVKRVPTAEGPIPVQVRLVGAAGVLVALLGCFLSEAIIWHPLSLG